MIQLTPHTPLFLGLDSIDFRCGIDKLALVSEQISGHDPKSGCVFVFRNRTSTSIKLLAFDGTGYWLMQKRLSQGKLRWWPRECGEAGLSAEGLLLVLRGDDPRGLISAPWRRVKTILDHDEETGRHPS